MNPWIVIGTAFVSAAATLCIVAATMADNPSRDQCRAANPGYDCTLGWVRGEAFK